MAAYEETHLSRRFEKFKLGYHVAEYLWRREVERQGIDAFIAIFHAIAHQYQVSSLFSAVHSLCNHYTTILFGATNKN